MSDRIRVSVGITVNLDNYEFARLDMGIEKDVECITNEVFAETFDALKILVEEKSGELEKEWHRGK